MQTLLADAVLGFHFLFIVFVVGGQACILIGGLLGWCWVRNLGFRIAHLLAISVVVVESWIGTICPLTIWEVTLRRMGGETTYTGTFVGHWVGRLIYYSAPEWVFIVVYTLFFVVVMASWFLVRPTRRKRAESPHAGY
jgi:hypothetical protein